MIRPFCYIDAMNTPFSSQLDINIRKTVTNLRKTGTCAMSLDNLRQVTPTPSINLDGAPRGTNAAYYYKEIFAEVANSRRSIKAFLI